MKHEQTDAKYNLSVLYEHGLGVQKDKLKALKLLLSAAESGNIRAKRKIDELM